MVADSILKLQNRVLWLLKILFFKKPGVSVGKILVFRTGSLGDSVCAIPAIESIAEHYPNAKIDILTNTGQPGLVGLNDLLKDTVYSEIVNYMGESRPGLFRNLRRRKYDMIIQLPQVDSTFLRLARDVIVFRSIAKAGFGWRVSQSPIFKRAQAKYLVFPNEIERLQNLLHSEGIQGSYSDKLFDPGPEASLIARNFFIKHGLQPGRPIACVVGAKRIQNRWPVEYYSDLIKRFNSQHFLLIGSKEDIEIANQLLSSSNVTNCCGQFSAQESAAVMALCCLTVANDTGPMHLSYAVGTPTVALFSSRDLPGKWFPPEGLKNVALREVGTYCASCVTTGDSCTNSCLRAITPSLVARYVYEGLPAD